MKRPRAAASAAAVALTLVLGACGGDGDDPTVQSESSADPTDEAGTTEEGVFNDADVEFAQGMIAHHQQAIEMSDIEIETGESTEVIELAERIKEQQSPEIDLMTELLEAWGVDAADEGGMDHGGDSSMMSEADMAALEAASGAELDRMFLEMMIEHHRGAIDMAEQEIEDGEAPEAKELARNIIDAQTAEIDEMEALLAELA